MLKIKAGNQIKQSLVEKLFHKFHSPFSYKARTYHRGNLARHFWFDPDVFKRRSSFLDIFEFDTQKTSSQCSAAL